MTINFRIIFALSLVASLITTVPLCLYLLRAKSWGKWSTAITSTLVTVGIFSGIYFALTYLEILQMHGVAYLIFIGPLTLVSGALALGVSHFFGQHPR